MPIAEVTGAVIPAGSLDPARGVHAVRGLAPQSGRAGAGEAGGQRLRPADCRSRLPRRRGRGTEDAGLTADRRLVLEIAESVLVGNDDDEVHVVAAQGAGRVAGHRRLRHRLLVSRPLQRFPVDILKIDRSFTARIGEGRQESPISLAVLALGRTLAVETIAEGIETADQWQRLQGPGLRARPGFPRRAAHAPRPATAAGRPAGAAPARRS
ncbi:MAG: EAL domain-containing protein [Vicinamibacterales bacterium]